MRLVLFGFLTLIFTIPTWAQLAPGKWESMISLNKTKQVLVAGNKSYFMSDLGIFYYDKSDNQLVSLTKTDGLSELEFSTMGYNETTKKMVIAYSNSNLDVIDQNGKIIQFPDIKRKNINGDKSIYKITCMNQFCYLACGFGIVVLDLERMEITDTYIIGDNGNYLTVYGIAFDNESIYAATKEGIRVASRTGVNLLVYSNWQLVIANNIDTYNYNFIFSGMGRIWAVHQSNEWFGDKTFSRHSKAVWYPEIESINKINSFNIVRDTLYYCSNRGIEILDTKGVSVVPTIEKYPFSTTDIPISPISIFPATDGRLWIADLNYGAISYKNGQFERYIPDGPIDNSMFSINIHESKLWISAGGRNSTWTNIFNPATIQYFNNEQWKYYNKSNLSALNDLRDVVDILPVSGEPDHFYAALWGDGLIEINDGKLINHFTEKNSTLENFISSDAYVRIGGMAFDNNQNLWVSNGLVENKLHRKTPTGEWTAYNLPELSGNLDVGKVLITVDKNIWMQVARNNGLYVMSPDGKSKRHLEIVALFQGADNARLETSMNDVYCFVQDRDDKIWVGTANGIAVFSSPRNIFDGTTFYASQPSVNVNNGKFNPLLSNQIVTAIAVDGGNQKWIGTRSDGLYLMSDDGTTEIEHFTMDNSPINSNNISSLAYDETTGMLYIGTSLGLIRYKTKTKGPEKAFTNVYAYPNPVRETYQGDIYITGLMENSNVKITDITGRLVYETTSEGGQATWNGADLAGRRVHTGVYLVFCASADGAESAVAKILFIR